MNVTTTLRSTSSTANILIVDDEPGNVLLLEQILRGEGYVNLRSTTDSRDVFPLFVEAEPDLILLDLMMPELSGFEVMERLEYLVPEETFLPILVLTADATPEAKSKALSGGATDFLTKPFDQSEVVLRIRNLLEMRAMHQHLRQQNEILETRVRERTADLEQAQIEILDRLARAAEFRDDDTGQHTARVGQTAALLAERAGLPHEQVNLIRCAAPLHDVGKIGISDLILLKPGKLTDEEFATMKMHAPIGAALLSGGHSDLVRMAELIAGSHHERWDGCGYPNALQGQSIPVEGRILAIADVFDALTHERPYKKAWTILEAVAEIERQGGMQFDPQLVAVFLTLPHERLI
jgi:putative two-component system response regulator